MVDSGQFELLSVLIVDDDRATRLIASRLLEHAGLRTVQAEDGAAAVEYLARNAASVGVVLLDVMMPRLDGFEVLERIRQADASREIPVILLTAHATDDDEVVRALELGADEHLSKPFSGKVLVAKVRAYYRRRLSQLANSERLKAAESLATTDSLTGLYNRRQFDSQLRVEANFASRHREPFALLMIDLDHFKAVNDTFGHPEGDRVLKYTAECLVNTLRGSDQAFRFGGEEFAALLRGSDRERALRAAERVNQRLRQQPFTFANGQQRPISASIGVAYADASNDFNTNELLQRADAALYRAKDRGRDRAEAEPEAPRSVSGEVPRAPTSTLVAPLSSGRISERVS